MKSAWTFFFVYIFSLHLMSQSFQWVKQVTGSNFETIYDVVTDASGNSYVVGTFKGTITLGSNTYAALELIFSLQNIIVMEYSNGAKQFPILEPIGEMMKELQLP